MWNDCPLCKCELTKTEWFIECHTNNITADFKGLGRSKEHYNADNNTDYFDVGLYRVRRHHGSTSIHKYDLTGLFISTVQVNLVLPFNSFNTQEKIEKLLLLI